MNDNLKNIIADNGEIIIDSLIDNEILKSIPVLGTSLNIVKGIKNIRDWGYLRKVKAFIENLGEITQGQRISLIEKSKADLKNRLKFGEALFTTIELSDTTVKMEYLAAAFEAFLNDELSTEELRAICFAINNVYIDDLILLMEENKIIPEDILKRCISSGLVTDRIHFSSSSVGIGVSGGGRVSLYKTGLCKRFQVVWKKYK